MHRVPETFFEHALRRESPGHRQAARHHSPWQYVIMSLKSPTKNAFHLKENSYFHQDRTLKEVQRKTIFIKIAPIVK